MCQKKNKTRILCNLPVSTQHPETWRQISRKTETETKKKHAGVTSHMWCYISLFIFFIIAYLKFHQNPAFSGIEPNILHYISGIESTYLGKVDEVHLHVNEKHSSAAPWLTGSSPFSQFLLTLNVPICPFLVSSHIRTEPQKNPLHKSSRWGCNFE